MKSYKKNPKSKSKTQKLYSMKGCSLDKSKKGGRKKMCWGTMKGGCGCGMFGGRKRRSRRMLAYPSSNLTQQTSFGKDYLAYTGQKGGLDLNPNLPYGQIPPNNYEFPPGVSSPQNLKGGGEINENVIYGPVNNYGGSHSRKRRGGMGGMWPDGLTGSAWGSQVSQWPGVDRISGDRNYLVHNDYKYDPQTQGVVNGRALSGGKTIKKRGGGLIPQDLLNLGRQAMFGLGSTYNALAGYSAPPNPMPYKDQLTDTPTLKNFKY